MTSETSCTLRISAYRDSESFKFDLELESDAHTPRHASGFYTQLDSGILSEVRWYMEEFLEEGDRPAQIRASQVRSLMSEAGVSLFRQIFEANEQSKEIWASIHRSLTTSRIEIDDQTESSTTLWELLRDPYTDYPLCLSTLTFVRAHKRVEGHRSSDQPNLRMLLTISRPSGPNDVEFRTIATTIFQGLRSQAQFTIDVLRPPTFDELSRVLRDAFVDGKPYDLVHFDGHGFYETDLGGFLQFENLSGGARDIPAKEFAKVMTAGAVKAVVMNACQSAYQDPADIASATRGSTPASLSRTLIVNGVPFVIAMNFNVYVASAKRFMEEFYRQIGLGRSCSVAGSLARKHLSIDGIRFDEDASAIDDWIVPTIFQSGQDLRVELSALPSNSHPSGIPMNMPPPPDLGFVGSNDALLQLDRAFDDHTVILLYGLAGAGKSATAVEFVSWYKSTNPLVKHALFNSFETSPSLDQVLLSVAAQLRISVPHEAINTPEVRARLASALAAKKTLWVWDNIETISTFPAEKREQFVDFLRHAKSVGLRILMTARGTQGEWIPNLGALIEMPGLRVSESIDLVKRLLSSRGIRRFDQNTFDPLFQFADGNPLTLTLTLYSYLAHEPAPSPAGMQLYIESLQEGVKTLTAEANGDKSLSLTASLNYGFTSTLSLRERNLLSLLSLFRVYANSYALAMMFRPDVDPIAAGLPTHDFSWSLKEFEDENHKSAEVILDKAVSLGLLRKTGPYNFWLHPAIHLRLTRILNDFYPGSTEFGRVQRAYCESISLFCMQFGRYFQIGGRDPVIGALYKEQENIAYALALSHKNSWWQAEMGLLQGLSALLLHQGRKLEWREAFLEVYGDFVDQKSMPLPGREKCWAFVVDLRLTIAKEDGDLDTAEFLARKVLFYEQTQTVTIPKDQDSELSDPDRKKLQNHAIAVGRVADILRDRKDPECIWFYKDAIEIYDCIEDSPGKAMRLFNMGHAYKNIPKLRDLDKARSCYLEAIKHYPETDKLPRAQALAQITMILEAIIEEKLNKGDATQDELGALMDEGIENCEAALSMFPPDAYGEIATLHNQMGTLLRFSPSDQDAAIWHLRKASQLAFQVGQYHQAASSRANLAQVFSMNHRGAEAVAAASEALEIFDTIGYSGVPVPLLHRLVRNGGSL